MSRSCSACVKYNKDKDSNPEQYKQLTESHEPECMVNHRGSAPAMELDGTVPIYNRSISKNGLRYVDIMMTAILRASKILKIRTLEYKCES